MKKLLLLLLLLSATAITTYAEQFVVNDITYETIDSVKVRVLGGPDTERVEIPARVTYNGVTYKVREIGDGAFARKKNLKEVIIPNSVTKFCFRSFLFSTLTTLAIPFSVRTIDGQSFSGVPLTKLTQHPDIGGPVTIGWPGSVKSFTYLAFGHWGAPYSGSTDTLTLGCEIKSLSWHTGANSHSAKTVYCYAEVPPTITSDFFTASAYDGTLYVPEGCVDAYRNAPYWQNFYNINQAPLEKVTLNYTELTMMKSQSMPLVATRKVKPDASIKWCSTNPDVAEVDDNGVVTVVGSGSCRIVASAADEPAAYASCIIYTYEDFTLSLNKQSLTMNKSDLDTLSVTLNPETTALSPIWSTTNPLVASVGPNGEVIATGEGECDITATVANRKVTCHVTVNAGAGVVLNQNMAKLQTGQTLQLSNTAETPVTWTVTDPTVASVDKNGVVTALKNGMVAVTASDSAGNTASCYIWCYKLGDLNEDMKVDVADQNTMLNIILGMQ